MDVRILVPHDIAESCQEYHKYFEISQVWVLAALAIYGIHDYLIHEGFKVYFLTNGSSEGNIFLEKALHEADMMLWS